MNRLVISIIVIVLAATLGACGSPAPTPTTAPAATGMPTAATLAVATATPATGTLIVTATAAVSYTVKTGRIRTQYPSPSAGLRNVAFLMALDTLRQEGYTVETTQIAATNLVASALVKGDLDIGYFSDQQAWTAAAQKAPIRTIMSFNGDPYVIAVKQDIKVCSDLQGRSVAVGQVASTNTAMLDQYVKRNCPGTQPETAIIPSSPSRFAALLTGQIDSALLETDDALQLESQAPGRFRVLRRFAEEFPLIEVGGYHVDANFAEQHPEIVRDFVTALIQAQRRVQDKQVLLGAVTTYLKDDPTAVAAVDTYLAQNAWDVNGGLTPQSIQATIDFLTGAKMLPAGMTVDQVADLSYLDAVLNELGRK